MNVLLGQKRRCRPCDRRVRSHPNSGCAGRGAPTPVSCHNPTFRGCPSALRRGRGVILAPVPTRRSTTRSCSATLERGSWICNALSKARPRLRHCRWRIRPVRSTFAKRHRSFFRCPLSSAGLAPATIDSSSRHRDRRCFDRPIRYAAPQNKKAARSGNPGARRRSPRA